MILFFKINLTKLHHEIFNLLFYESTIPTNIGKLIFHLLSIHLMLKKASWLQEK